MTKEIKNLEKNKSNIELKSDESPNTSIIERQPNASKNVFLNKAFKENNTKDLGCQIEEKDISKSYDRGPQSISSYTGENMRMVK